jgi:ABC-type glycerol-3-phosphate transport system substrate-binding protein
MNNNSTFQLVLLGVFGIIVIAGVLLFAGYGAPAGNQIANVTLNVWGQLPADKVNEIFSTFNTNNQSTVGALVYTQKDPATFETDLVNALASGKGPDIVFMPESLLVREADKLLPLSYQQFSQRNYLDTYTDGSDIFLTNAGILALPVMVDPVVLYWNRSLFSSAGIATPPKYWDEVLTLPQKLVVKDQKGTISQGAIALGGYANITHAKDILASLFFQVGDTITTPQFTDNGISVKPTLGINSATGQSISPSESALRFYVGFADPTATSYSWNSSLQSSRDLFAQGSLAMYVGVASDLPKILAANPHLSFDVTQLPTIRPTSGAQPVRKVYGAFTGAAVLAASKYSSSAAQAVYLLSQQASSLLAMGANGAPVRRDLLSADTSSNARQSVFNQAAINAHGWLDPSPLGTDMVFKNMVASLLAGGVTARDALDAARADMNNLVPNQQ